MSMQLSNTKSSQNRDFPFTLLHPARRPQHLSAATMRIPRRPAGKHLLPAGGEASLSGVSCGEQEQLEGAGEGSGKMDDLRDEG